MKKKCLTTLILGGILPEPIFELKKYIDTTFATKDDLTKGLQDLTDRMFLVFATKKDLRELEERIDRKMSEKMDPIFEICDSISKRLDNFLSEHVIINHRLNRLEEHTGLSV